MSNFRGIIVEYIDAEKREANQSDKKCMCNLIERLRGRIIENGSGRKVEGKRGRAANMRSDTRNAGTDLNNFCSIGQNS
jgi:hypothetical protein